MYSVKITEGTFYFFFNLNNLNFLVAVFLQVCISVLLYFMKWTELCDRLIVPNLVFIVVRGQDLCKMKRVTGLRSIKIEHNYIEFCYKKI